MAVPASKRRKLSHSPSEEGSGDERASAASEELNQDGRGEDMRFENESVEDDYSSEEMNGEEDEESDVDEMSNQSADRKSAKSAKAQKKPQSTKRANTSTLEASAAAYTGGTFQSNMFKLQVDEMLGQIRPRQGKREKTAEEALHKLKKAIDHIPAREPMSVNDAERDLIKKSKVAIPFPEPRPAHDVKYKLAYAKPANINVVGAYPLKLATRTDKSLAIDMLVTIPKSLLQEKDYINHRYFYKRSYYMACIAAGLKSALAKDLVVKFANFHDNPLHPILVVQAKEQKSENNWQINIIPGLPETAFSNDKLLPSKNCVRPAKEGDSDDNTLLALPSTPFYNASVQADSQITAYLKLLHQASTSCEAFKDACLLGRVWLRQRALTSQTGKGGFGNFEWAALVAVLLQTGGGNGMPLLSSGYSSYQLFKATLQYLAAKDLVKQPAVLQAGNLTLNTEHGQPTFFDGARSMNILYKMTASSYQYLHSEARTTLQMLSDTLGDTFESAFILRADNVLQRHDVTVNLPLSALSSADAEDRDLLARYQSIHTVLARGLGDRATQLQLVLPSQETWETGSARPSFNRKGELSINITLNPANTSRSVDHGPAAENKKEAAEFRKFWGEKAELRRFRDGAILESLVWSTKEGGLPIVQQIITWLLWRHFGKPVAEQLSYHGDEFAKLVKHSSGISAFQPLMEAFKTLETDLRAMDDLPLTIRSLMPADPQLRYASPSAPMDNNTAMKTPANVVIQFEGSGRWPDDLVAIQRTKIAFLLQISTLYTNLESGVVSRVGLENQDLDFQNQGFLDVTYPSTGSSFRIRVHHDREQTLLERILKDKSAAPSTKESASQALSAYKRNYLRSPAHTAAVQKLCTRHSALSPTIRVLKKWFEGHLLTSHFADELIELFAINTFTRPWPFQPPSSVRTAFTRTLSFLSRWGWRSEPLIVDINADLKAESTQVITTRFEAWRKLDPSLNRVCLFVASSVDTEGTTWTDGVPAKVVSGRMTALAKAATGVIEAQGLSVEPESLFVSPTNEYDFVIHLASTNKKKSRKSSEFKNLIVADEADPDVVGFAPQELFYQEVERVYGQAVVLFKGEGVIAGLWTPYTSSRGWKVNLAYSTIPVKDGEEVLAEVNKEGILKEIARLGDDLVKKIDVNRV
ncbi:pre-rRNA processing protein-like protein Utp22 [Delphinella strobiligena]|nr:pre-rRNA processing protein-like protein Utp22 [Delphinella strobiligena]